MEPQAVRRQPRRLGEALSSWRREGLIDLRPGVTRLPVRELSLTQTGPGSGAVDATIVASTDVTLLQGRVKSPSVGVTILARGYTAFSFTTPIDGPCQVNGDVARPSMLYTPVVGEGMYSSGGPRDFTSALVRRDRFARVVAALCAIDPGDVPLENCSFELAPPAASRLRQRLNCLIGEYCAPPGSQAPHRFTDAVFSLLADVYLENGFRNRPTSNGVRRAQEVVRRAEEQFAAAGADPISLADLCHATGVSARSLYRAFDVALGVPPLEYFRKRRLANARLTLLGATPSRGGIKRAALGAGLTELGRFSVEYRQLFGESPSVTLNKTSG